MHPIVKIIFGLILMLGSAWIIYKYTLTEFWITLQGIVPPIVFVLGLFIVWLEWDELRIERELKAETRRVRRRKRRR